MKEGLMALGAGIAVGLGASPKGRAKQVNAASSVEPIDEKHLITARAILL
jgi:F0F1-type ATP synthase membrane subunit c/vacuolar-type H+-ATPase subunit K